MYGDDSQAFMSQWNVRNVPGMIVTCIKAIAHANMRK